VSLVVGGDGPFSGAGQTKRSLSSGRPVASGNRQRGRSSTGPLLFDAFSLHVAGCRRRRSVRRVVACRRFECDGLSRHVGVSLQRTPVNLKSPRLRE
jgi:hypothetical protein